MANDKDRKKEIIQEALERYKNCITETGDNRTLMGDDLDFLIGNQWPEKTKRDRESDDRPCLVINRLPKYIDQVVNDSKKNPPQIKIRPKDNGIDKKTSDVVQGLTRHIQNSGHAKSAIGTAYDYAVTCGLGWFGLLTEYCDNDTFDQDIKFRRIDNPLAVVAPMHLCKEQDYSDLPYCFVIDKISKDEYSRTYPDSNINDFDASDVGDWVTDDGVIVAEYYRVVIEEGMIYKLADGSVVDKLPEGQKPVKTRQSIKKTVEWYKLSAVEILEETVFPGKFIPIVPIVGKEINVKGKKYYISLTRNAKDSQKLINYAVSCKAERLALAPKAPYVAADGQIEGYEGIWAESNRRNIAVLPYKPISVNGTIVGRPERTAPVNVDSGFVEMERDAVDSLKATTGIFDASIGAKSNETSGIAIRARENQGDTANYHFLDNQAIALRHAGRIIVDIIPTVIDTPRAIRILGDDYKEKIVQVNQYYSENNNQVLYNLTAGRYDVDVDIGPAFSTQREEAVANLSNLVQSVPIIGEVSADVITRNMDFPASDELADRLERFIEIKYPNIIEKKNENQSVKVPQLIAQLQRMQSEMQADEQTMMRMDQIIEQLQMQIKDKDNQIKSKNADRAAKMEEAVLRADTAIETTKMKIDADMLKQLISEQNKMRTELEQLRVQRTAPGAAPIAAQNNMGD